MLWSRYLSKLRYQDRGERTWSSSRRINRHQFRYLWKLSHPVHSPKRITQCLRTNLYSHPKTHGLPPRQPLRSKSRLPSRENEDSPKIYFHWRLATPTMGITSSIPLFLLRNINFAFLSTLWIPDGSVVTITILIIFVCCFACYGLRSWGSMRWVGWGAGLDMALVCSRILFFAYLFIASFCAASLAGFEIDGLSDDILLLLGFVT